MSTDNSIFAQILLYVFNDNIMNEINKIFPKKKRKTVATEEENDGSYIINIKNEDDLIQYEKPTIKMTVTKTEKPEINEKKVEPIKVIPADVYIVHRIRFNIDGKEQCLKIKHKRYIVRP